MIPPLGKTALVWGLFLGVSANIRYQVCKRVPCMAYDPCNCVPYLRVICIWPASAFLMALMLLCARLCLCPTACIRS